MDQVAPAAYNPHLQRVLKSFQSAAEASLSGPSRYMAVWQQHIGDPNAVQQPKSTCSPEITLQEIRKAMLSSSLNNKKATSTTVSDKLTSDNNSGYFPSGSFPAVMPGVPVAPHNLGPVFLPMDNSHSEKSDTLLESQPISCFIVGGEKRLCLPQILNTVLQDFTLQQINTICDDLHIFCSRCNPQQLDLLKMTGVLPPSAPSCGLITKTDAERLCNALLHGSPEKSADPPSPNSFKVYHECFGKCKGVFNPDLYTNLNAKCIDCCDCHGMFSPQKFVCHSHKALENRTCHWGFDSANWRAYLLLAKDNENMQKALDDMKEKYDLVAGYRKRRESPNHRKENEAKRTRYEENGKMFDCDSNPWGEYAAGGMSAFRPWSPSLVNLIKEGKIPAPGCRGGLAQLLPPFLQKGPPVLLNPERVIPFTDTKRYDRHFAPNVSLAPQALEKADEKPELESPYKHEPKRLLSTTSSFSMSAASSSSMSALSSPSLVKVEKNPELELSSSDESSFRSESVHSTPRDDLRHLAEITVPCESELSFDRDVMMGLIKRALEISPDKKGQEKEQILQQMAEIWSRQEDRIRALVQSRKHIIQEMELLRVSKQERLQEMSDSRFRLRQEVERLQGDLETRSREANSEKRKYKQELELLKASKYPEVHSVKSKYKGQIETLRCQLSQYETLHTTMVTEMGALRHQLRELGQEVADFSSSGHQVTGLDLSNGHPSSEEISGWKRKSDDPKQGSSSTSWKHKEESATVVNGFHDDEKQPQPEEDDREEDDDEDEEMIIIKEEDYKGSPMEQNGDT